MKFAGIKEERGQPERGVQGVDTGLSAESLGLTPPAAGSPEPTRRTFPPHPKTLSSSQAPPGMVLKSK